MKIFIIRDGIELGPYTAGEINTQLQAGVFSASDVAKYEGSVALWPLLAVPGILSPQQTSFEPPQSVAQTVAPMPSSNAWVSSTRWLVFALLSCILCIFCVCIFCVVLGIYMQQSADPAASGDAAEAALPSRAEWRQKLRDNFTIPSGHQLLANEQRFLAVMGKPDDVRHQEQDTYWYYKCSDGEVQLAFSVDPDLAGAQIIAEVSDE